MASLSRRIKEYLFSINDGADVRTLRKDLKADNSDILSALLELGHEVIQAGDGRWYLERWAKLEEEPEPEAVVEDSITETPVAESVECVVAETPTEIKKTQDEQTEIVAETTDVGPEISTAPITTNARKILDWLATEQAAGRGPYSYQQVAELMNVRLSSVRSSKRTIYSRYPDEIPIFEAMMLITDPLANLKKAPSHQYRETETESGIDVGVYRWKVLSKWLANEDAQQRGPFEMKDLREQWSPISSLRQVRRAVAAIKAHGDNEERERVRRLVIPEIFDTAKDIPSFLATPAASAMKPIAQISYQDTETSLNNLRTRLLLSRPEQAGRWKLTLEGLNSLMGEFGVPDQDVVRQDLQAMAVWFSGGMSNG